MYRQDNFWSDGKFFWMWLEKGRWGYYHFAYFPAAETVHHTIGALLDWSELETLYFLSAVMGALGCGILLMACRVADFSWAASMAAFVLLASTPVVGFFSTCIEVHILQMAASAACVLWMAWTSRTGAGIGTGLVPIFLYLAICATHLVGITWLLGSLFVVLGPAGSLRKIKPVLTGAALIAVFAIVVYFARRYKVGTNHLGLSFNALAGPYRWSLAWREVLVPAGFLYGLLLLAVIAELARSPRNLRHRASLTTMLLFGALIPFAFVVDIEERGAYFISLLPIGAFWVARWMNGMSAIRIALVAVPVVGCQLWQSQDQIRTWESSGEIPAWVADLERETEKKLVLFTMDKSIASAAFRHTSVLAFPVVPKAPTRDLEGAGFPRLLKIAQDHAERGFRIGITQDIAQSQEQAMTAFLATLRERYGEPVPYSGAPCWLFPPHEYD